jgi:hypothetical protein
MQEIYDFEPIRQQLQQLRRRHPSYRLDIIRFEKTVEAHIARYGQIMVEYRKRPGASCLSRANAERDAVLAIMQDLSKRDLVALLSKPAN